PGHGQLRRHGPADHGAGGACRDRRVPRVPIPGGNPRRQQHLLPARSAQCAAQDPRRAGAGFDAVPEAGAREAEGDADLGRVAASRGQRRLLRRREEAQRDLPDGRAGAETGHPRRDRFRAGHRRAETGGAGRQHAAFARARVPDDHPLPAPARLRAARFRARAGRWPHCRKWRQVAGVEAGGARLCRSRRAPAGRGGGMSQPASLPLVESLLDAPLPPSGLAWLDTARQENLEAFAASGLPDTRVEAWKYTALRALGQRRFAALDRAAPAVAMDAAGLVLPGVDGPRLVFVNGVFRADLSPLANLPEGLALQPLSRALAGDAEPLRFSLSRHYREPGDAFARINAAQAGDGVVLRVAAHAKITEPVHLVFVAAAAGVDLAWHARNVIELGEGAGLNLVEHHLASGEPTQLATMVSDIELRDGARLQHTVLQNTAASAYLI